VSEPSNSSNSAVFSISVPRELLEQVNNRAEALGLPRSTYLALLAKQDLGLVGQALLPANQTAPTTQVDLTEQERDFLFAAIPQLVQLERQQRRGESFPPLPPPAPHITSSWLWQRFDLERQAILENKWYLSQRAGHDVGVEAAIRDWLEHHAAAWEKSHPVLPPAP
jgi:hypothetical protein